MNVPPHEFDGDFWHDAAPLILQNPRAPRPAPPLEQIGAGRMLFATSGSSAAPKWVVLTKKSLMVSAANVNHFFKLGPADRWLRCLPVFHVAGMAIHARAAQARAEVVVWEQKWNPHAFSAALADTKARLVSLVPTQIFDLVQANVPSPPELKLVFVGGGALAGEIAAAAKRLGWPLVFTFGMTETASMFAAKTSWEAPFHFLPDWEGRADAASRLEVRGASLFAGYFMPEGDAWAFLPRDEWFRTEDRVEMQGDGFHWLGRSDRIVKILGEQVDLDEVERTLSALAKSEVIVLAVPDQRTGQRLLAACEADCKPALDAYHETCAPFGRIAEEISGVVFPRSELGKVRRGELLERLRQQKPGTMVAKNCS